MARETRKELLKDDEFMEAAFDLGTWFEENYKTVFRAAAAIIIGVLVIAAILTFQRSKEAGLRATLAEGSSAFTRAAATQFSDSDALADALVKFEEVEAKGGGSTTGAVATYYRGATLYRLGRSDEALEALKSFQAKAGGMGTIEWAGNSLLANLMAESGDVVGAIAIIQPIAEDAETSHPRDQALLQLGDLHATAGDDEAARRAWETIGSELPNSPAASLAAERLGS